MRAFQTPSAPFRSNAGSGLRGQGEGRGQMKYVTLWSRRSRVPPPPVAFLRAIFRVNKLFLDLPKQKVIRIRLPYPPSSVRTYTYAPVAINKFRGWKSKSSGETCCRTMAALGPHYNLVIRLVSSRSVWSFVQLLAASRLSENPSGNERTPQSRRCNSSSQNRSFPMLDEEAPLEGFSD